MKKYLLLFLMCVYASIGAWAQTASCNQENGTHLSITTNGDQDLNGISEFPGMDQYAIIKVTGDLSQTGISKLLNAYRTSYDFTFDFSGATIDVSTITNLSIQTGYRVKKYVFSASALPAKSVLDAVPNEYGSFYAIALDETNHNAYLYVQNGIYLYDTNVSSVFPELTDTYKNVYICGNPQNAVITNLSAAGFTVQEYVVPSSDPYTVDGCTITINMAKAGEKSFAELLDEAKAKMATQTSICTLIVQGTVSDTELEALNDDNLSDATKIDLSGATIATGSSINNITLPASLEQLVLPKGMGITKLPDALRTKFAGASNLVYAYSPTSDTQTATAQHVADLVWVNQAGGLDKAIINEAKLRTAIYVKVESAVALNADDVDLATNNKQTGENTYENVSLNNTSTDATNYAWQYIDMSGANLQNDVIVSYKAPQATNSYRLILPDGWDPNRMSIIPSVKEPNYGSGLAAVYSYTAQGFLQILEINDTQYKSGALADNRIVRDGTKAVRVVSGEYNGTPYGSFGEYNNGNQNHLLEAINAASPSIEAITITNTRCVQSSISIDNDNLIYIEIEGIKNANNYDIGPTLNVDGCKNLGTLNLINSVFASVDASVPALEASGDDPSTTGLTSVDMSGTTVVGTTDLSTSPITNTGFVTNDDTWFKDDLDLSKTALTTFTTTAKVGITTANPDDTPGDIILNENNLTGVSLNQVQFQNPKSIIYVRKSSDSNNSDYGVLTGSLNANETIIVPQDFDAENRIVPYVAASIKKEAYVPPVVSYENTDMHLHEAETSGETPDKYVYWYTGENIENGIATIRAEGSIQATLLSDAYIKNKTFVKVKIKGYISPTSLGDIGNITTQVLDLSELDLTHEGACSISDLKEWFCKTYWDLNLSVKFLILPSSATQQTLVARDHLSGLKNIYCAIALSDYDTNNNFDFVAYNKVAGTLQPAVIAAGRGTINGSTMIRGGRTAYYPTMSGNSNRSAVISGNINAYDLSCNTKLSADGHLSFNKRYANEALLADDRTNTGTETNIAGAFSGSNGPKTLDLKYVDIAGDEYINDICISYLVPTNYLKYLTIPVTSSVKETPSYFIQHNTIKEICIPSNIEIIRTHFAPSVDHIWTTGYNVGQIGGDIYNMTYDNGAVSAANEAPAYGYTDYTFSGLYPHGTYTFSSNLKLIESNAFSNTTPHVSDVYVLAKKAPECHVDAFCTAMYIGNSGFAPNIVGGVITRDSYVNGSNWITMLHYPRECVSPEVQRYTDPTRQYSIASNEVDGKGGVLYYPSYGEFLAAYAQGTTGYLWNAWDRTYEFGMLKASLSIGNTGWTLKNQQDANAKFLANPDLTTFPDDTKYTCTSFYDVTAGGKESQPSGLVQYYDVRWNEKVLSDKGTGIQLYPQANTANTDLDNTVTARDFRGWHQFVLNAFAANTDVPMQPSRSYITDTDWWTVCLPYDLTYNEVMLFYGDVNSTGQVNDATKVPYLALLSNVVRDEKNKYITLNFSSNVMEHTATYDGVNGVWNIDANTAPTGTDVVLHKGVPYMIKPTFKANAGRQFDVYGPGQAISSELSGDRITALDDDYPGLYEKLKLAEDIAGQEFREMMENNLYTVPAFLPKDDWDGNYHSEDRVDATEYEYNNKKYYRSSKYDYTFVGAFMKNIIPPYAYFLGYKGKALYVYADYLSAAYKAITGKKPDYENEFRWTNNSCEIMPNMLSTTEGTKANSKANKYNLGHTGGHNGKVTEASGTGENMRPARWEIFGTSAGHLTAVCADDHTYNNNGGVTSAKGMDMLFDADFVIVTPGEVTNIEVVKTAEGEITGKVFTIDGRYVGESLTNLPKGVYVRNGKKVVVK